MLKNKQPIKYLTLDINELHDNERVKQRSQFLRGTLNASLETVESASIAESDTLLTKFHGIYQQEDRDKRKTGKSWIYMVRTKFPGTYLATFEELASSLDPGFINPLKKGASAPTAEPVAR